jgi:hypothetical protein
MMAIFRRLAAIGLLLLAPLAAEVSFNRDIRPIMSDTCFRCHGPDKNTRMAGLRLDIRDEALKPNRNGVAPIVPGEPEKSGLVQRVFAASKALIMPPVFAHKELTEAQKETIRKWVAEGAVYEGHWAYQPVQRPEPPEIRNNPQPPVRNPIDAFIQQRLRSAGLLPSAEADRRTLIRRVSLDLTGLPPTPADVDAFVKDTSPGAYEKVVDRLLASQAYAEKQTLHWLDAVRYADTCGFHGDNPFPAWPYRDYVLRSFRDNKPFDQFTREQLAGDLLPDATVEQKVASAYNRMNRTSAEGGLQPKEYLAKYGADRVRTLSSVWLGSTMGCAECHDHKFDPFTAKDFYSMKAFFADIKETGLVPDRGPEAWGTQLTIPSAEQKAQLEEFDRTLAELKKELEARESALAAPDEEALSRLLNEFEAGGLAWRFQRPIAAAAKAGAKLTIYNDEPVETTHYTGPSLITEKLPGNGVVVASGPNPDNETYSVTIRPGAGTWTAFGVQFLQDESLPSHRLARGSDRLVLSEVEAEIAAARGSKPQPVRFVLANDNLAYPSPELHPMNAIDGDPRTGWGVADPGNNVYPFLALRLAEPITTGEAAEIVIRLRHDSSFRRATAGRFRVALSSATYSWPQPGEARRATAAGGGLPDGAVRALKARDGNSAEDETTTGGGKLSEEETRKAEEEKQKRLEASRKTLREYLAWSSPATQSARIAVARTEAARGLLEAGIPRVVVTEATEPKETRLLPRGNWMDDSGEILQPAIPAFLGKLETSGRATRRDLANWIVSPENPLTARVFVNRTWRQLFGTGLSKVLEDLGSQGELPTHPELLDWLAAEFMQPAWHPEGSHAWDVKHLLRTILTSHTYRQSSLGSKLADERDPDNRLLSRQNRPRLDAEIVHDVALASAGLLSGKFGGPSVRPPQPEGYLSALNFPKREYSQSHGEDLYRRAVYTHWQRTFLHPSLAAFDAPTREECVLNRSTSNTPLQALVLLNDPIYVEAARVFGQNIWKSGRVSVRGRIDWAFERALSRPARADERKILAALFHKNLARYQREPKAARALVRTGEYPLPNKAPAAELAAWTAVARAILNMHETITRY